MDSEPSFALPPVSQPSSAEPLFAQHLLLPTIGTDGTVNLHAPSCSVRVEGHPHVCGCADLSQIRNACVLESLSQFMRYDIGAFGGLILGGDEAAKLDKLQKMQDYAAQYLQTTMPTPTHADAEKLRQYFEPHRCYLFPPT